MASELIKHISDSSFEADVLKSSQPVLVDYWAEWCGPCKMIAPILDEVSATYEGKLQIAKLNVDENGNAQNVQVIKSPSPVLDAPVAAAVRQFRFRPATLDNQPVATDLTLTVVVAH